MQRTSDAPEFRARLVHAAKILDEIDHPGAERLVALEDHGDATTLVTVYAGGRSLELHTPRRVQDIISLGAAVARMLCDLHAAGITHGPLVRSGIRLGSGGDPVLCGFGDGQLHPIDQPDRWWPARAEDVRSLGELCSGLLADAASRRRPDLADRFDRRRLAHLCDRISGGSVTEAAEAAAGLARLSRGG